MPKPVTNMRNTFKTFEQKGTPTSAPMLRRRAATVHAGGAGGAAASKPTSRSNRDAGGAAARTVSLERADPADAINALASAGSETAGEEYDTRAESIASMFGGTTRTPAKPNNVVGTPTTVRRRPRKKSVAELDLEHIQRAGIKATVAESKPKEIVVDVSPRKKSVDRSAELSHDLFENKAGQMAAKFGGMKGAVNATDAALAEAATRETASALRASTELDPTTQDVIAKRRDSFKTIEATPTRRPMIRRRSVTEVDRPPPESASIPEDAPTQPSNLGGKAATLPAGSTLPGTPRNEAGSGNPMRGRASTGWTPKRADGCGVCSKAVYFSEKLQADGAVFHKACFRCKECNKMLSVGSYASLDGQIFCKPCFKKLFKLNGNYATGFGKEQHKMKWQRANSVSS